MERRSFVRSAGIAGVLAAGAAPAIVHAQTALAQTVHAAIMGARGQIYV